VYNIYEKRLVYDVKNGRLKTINNNAASLEKALPQYTNTIQASLKDKAGNNLTDEEILTIVRAINNTNE